MDTTEVIIARLVLGYLKGQKCRASYKEFLKTSPHLQSDLTTRIKYLPTRFLGLTLEDILSEYFEISKIVQGRLEVTNYYNECHPRNKSLVQQLFYLLHQGQSSRTSTPCPRSPQESNFNETSPSHAGHVSDVETTPVHTLPGNIRSASEDSYLQKISKRKTNSKVINRSANGADHCNLQTTEKESDMSEVLAQTLLENKEFHEKIAQTINKVAENQCRVSSKTIKTVVEETEADPIFDKILEEIIGSTSVIENCNGAETSSTTSSTPKETGDEEYKGNGTQKHLPSNHSDDDLNQTIRTYSNTKRVEEQNDEAVRSIVANSNVKSNPSGNNQVNNEVTLFNGTLDTYLISNTCNAKTQTQTVQNPLYINTTGNLLMVSNTQIDSTKQYYLVNKQTQNWGVPQVQTPNVITEQDILAMPTVIVNEEWQNISQELASNSALQSRNVKLPSIIPKPIIGIPADYFNAKNASEKQSGLKNVLYPKTTKNSDTSETHPVANSCEAEPKETKRGESLPDLLKKQEEHVSEATTSQQNVEVVEHLTPPPVVERIQKTPKSGSHVRNLDFSTPPKITSTHKKAVRNKVDVEPVNKPQFVHKKRTAKSLRMSQDSLPKEQDKILQKPLETDVNAWDADLRAKLAVPIDEEQDKKTKTKKKKTPLKRVTNKTKRAKGSKKQDTSIERDAAIIEAALQTPVKTENQKLDHVDAIDINEDVIKKETTFIPPVSENDIQSKKEHCTNKTILSPSKLNANKRKLISSEITTATESVKLVDEGNTFITPEMVRDNFHHPIKAVRNITAMFDTPLKDGCLPKTPGIDTPNTSLNTPFSKMLEANLKGIDISSLPTPNIPVTPNFPPFTPTIEGASPYSNRPTDYSTSSSYYQPSDSEPNRSLEANVLEIEKQPIIVLNNIVLNENEQCNKSEKDENKVNPKLSHTVVDERLKMFKGNIIGKKNLSLMKRNINSESTSSSESSSESSDEDEYNTSGSSLEKSNQTIIHNKPIETPKRSYCLRNRTTCANKKEENKKIVEEKGATTNKKQSNKDKRMNLKHNKIHKDTATTDQSLSFTDDKLIDKQIKEDGENEIVPNISEEVVKTKLTERSSLEQAELKKELKEKLMRTLNKIKSSEKPVEKKNASKAPRISNGSFMKIKLVPNQKNKRKTKLETPKKNIQSGINNMKKDTTSRNQVSRDENKNNSKVSSTRVTKDTEKCDKSASDVEAQNLIEGLKERDSRKNTKCDDTSKDSPEQNCHERSTSEIETEWRETYDTVMFEGEHECIVYNESKKITKSMKDYNLEVLEKSFIGKVFIDEVNEEIDIPLVVSPFYTLLDLSPHKKRPQKQNTAGQKSKSDQKSEEKSSSKKIDTDKKGVLENQCHQTGNSKEQPESPCTKKRKVEIEDSCVPQAKDCKTLLQQINVDTFLNNIYGKT